MLKRTLSILAVGAGLAFAASPAFAHGGSHPTPWPQPPDTPPPSPSPGPSPSPSTPSSPSTPTTPSRPTSSGGGLTGGPTGPAKPTSQGKPSGELVWEHWWTLNKWNYTRAGRRGVQSSGGGEAEPTTDSPAVAFLKKCLGDEYFDIRSAAALALGKTGLKHTADALRPLVDDANPTVQESAILALGMLRDTRNIEVLSGILSAKGRYKDQLRALAAVALGLTRDPAATAVLVKVLESGGDEEVQSAAVVALGLLKDKTAAQPLMLTIQASAGRAGETVRAYAITALGKLGLAEIEIQKKPVSVPDYLCKLLVSDKSKEVRRSAVLALGALGDEKVLPKLVAVVAKDDERDAMVRNFAMVAMARLAQSDRAKLVVRRELENVLMQGKEYSGKGFSALALGLLGDPAGATALRRAFESESDPSNKSAAAIGLGLLGNQECVMALLGAIQLSGDAKIRGYCCLALGMLKATQAVEELRRVLTKETNPELRAAAAIALANVGDPQALDILKKALDDKNSYLKMTTVLAIGYFRDDSVVADLIKAYEAEKSNDVKAIIVVALGYIVDPNDVPVLKEVATDFNYLLHYPSIDLVLRLF
jgi:HEAT repeat protein